DCHISAAVDDKRCCAFANVNFGSTGSSCYAALNGGKKRVAGRKLSVCYGQHGPNKSDRNVRTVVRVGVSTAVLSLAITHSGSCVGLRQGAQPAIRNTAGDGASGTLLAPRLAVS